MRQIVAPIETVSSLCGSQKYSENVEYRMSCHVLKVPVGKSVLLYHSMLGEVLLLSTVEIESTEIDMNLKEILVRKLFLVPMSFNEKEYADQIRKIIALSNKNQNRLHSFKIFTTLECNARCFYCYENRVSKISMSDDTANDTADYILRTSNGKNVKLHWFGGEPLYNQRAIDIITSELKKREADFVSHMISNGYLFDHALVSHAKQEWNLQKVQITLDGTETVYNRTKAFIYPKENAFQRVLSNIDLLLDEGIHVLVRLNIHQGNADDLFALSEQLGERFYGKEGLNVYLALLRDDQGELLQLGQVEALEKYRKLNDLLLKTGLRKAMGVPKVIKRNYCMADSDEMITILPNGDLGICEHFSDKEIIGSIYSKELNKDVIRSWKETVDSIDQCNSCVYYPQCNNLKKCPYVLNRCTELDRQIRIYHLRESVLHEYYKTIGGDV